MRLPRWVQLTAVAIAAFMFGTFYAHYTRPQTVSYPTAPRIIVRYVPQPPTVPTCSDVMAWEVCHALNTDGLYIVHHAADGTFYLDPASEPCAEDVVLVGSGSFNNGYFERYECGPARDSYDPNPKHSYPAAP